MIIGVFFQTFDKSKRTYQSGIIITERSLNSAPSPNGTYRKTKQLEQVPRNIFQRGSCSSYPRRSNVPTGGFLLEESPHTEVSRYDFTFRRYNSSSRRTTQRHQVWWSTEAA